MSAQKAMQFDEIPIRGSEYCAIRSYLHETAGIELGPDKQMLVTGRLRKRLRHHQFGSYQEYFDFIRKPGNDNERQVIVDLLTTNETYFFRERDHFDFLRNVIIPAHPPQHRFRVWSGASSTGEEAYSIAMELATHLKKSPWEIVGSDISHTAVEHAKRAHYSLYRTDGIPRSYLQKYCLKGTGPYAGSLLIDKDLRKHVHFTQVNLIKPLPDLGRFDVIFLRNVLIYFNQDTKATIIRRLSRVLRPGGYLLIGHSESLKGMDTEFKYVAPTTYRKPC